jgi:hypothetical protein
MIDELIRITSDLEYIIDHFSPVLNELRNKQNSPIFLSSFSNLNLKNLNNISNWVIILLKADLYDSKVTQMLKYDEKHKILKFYIILDELFFKNKNKKKMKEIKNIIIVHEFIHFLAIFYSSITAEEKTLREKLIERHSLTYEPITNENTSNLHKFLYKENLIDDFYSFEQVNDAHFRTGLEKMSLDYAELFKNFLFSPQMLDKYLTPKARERFFNLLKKHKSKKAKDLIVSIINNIAKKEFLPVDFVVNQINDLIMKLYLNEYV